jgi:hypothetical protein
MTPGADEATKKQLSDCHALRNWLIGRIRKHPDCARGKGPHCSLCGVDMSIVLLLLVCYLLSPFAILALFGIAWAASRIRGKGRTSIDGQPGGVDTV